VCAGLIGLAAACSSRKPAPAPPRRARVGPEIIPLPSAPTRAAELIVGSRRGLEAWGRDGRRKRLISAGAALRPRWLDDGTVLVINPDRSDDLLAGGRLDRVTLADGKRSLVARLPPFACAGSQQPRALKIQDGADFVVDQGSHLACMDLMDRDLNRAAVVLKLRIDLRSGAIKRWLEAGHDFPCAPAPGVATGKPPGEAVCSLPAPEEAPATPAFPFSLEEGEILRTGGEVPRRVLQLDGYVEAQRSPSGRWAVLEGDMDAAGDSRHRRLLLLDRSSGRVFPISDRAGAWPAPLRGTGKKPARLQIPITATIRVVAETDVRWLGPADDELLVVGDRIVRPGGSSFSVAGELAR